MFKKVALVVIGLSLLCGVSFAENANDSTVYITAQTVTFNTAVGVNPASLAGSVTFNTAVKKILVINRSVTGNVNICYTPSYTSPFHVKRQADADVYGTVQLQPGESLSINAHTRQLGWIGDSNSAFGQIQYIAESASPNQP